MITPESCEGRYYKINYKYGTFKYNKTKSCYKNISWPFICSVCGDLIFGMFFVQLTWWIKTRQIFKKFDQRKRFQILLYTL